MLRPYQGPSRERAYDGEVVLSPVTRASQSKLSTLARTTQVTLLARCTLIIREWPDSANPCL